MWEFHSLKDHIALSFPAPFFRFRASRIGAALKGLLKSNRRVTWSNTWKSKKSGWIVRHTQNVSECPKCFGNGFSQIGHTEKNNKWPPFIANGESDVNFKTSNTSIYQSFRFLRLQTGGFVWVVSVIFGWWKIVKISLKENELMNQSTMMSMWTQSWSWSMHVRSFGQPYQKLRLIWSCTSLSVFVDFQDLHGFCSLENILDFRLDGDVSWCPSMVTIIIWEIGGFLWRSVKEEGFFKVVVVAQLQVTFNTLKKLDFWSPGRSRNKNCLSRTSCYLDILIQYGHSDIDCFERLLMVHFVNMCCFPAPKYGYFFLGHPIHQNQRGITSSSPIGWFKK